MRKSATKQSASVQRACALSVYAKYLDYIKNAGGRPTVEWFDEDWSPNGPNVRKEMEAAGMVMVIDGRVYLA